MQIETLNEREAVLLQEPDLLAYGQKGGEEALLVVRELARRREKRLAEREAEKETGQA